MAFKYFEKACSLDYGLGCNNLGVNYEKGLGVGKDASKAASLYKKACALGYEKACNY
jgi:TPR repeat protein